MLCIFPSGERSENLLGGALCDHISTLKCGKKITSPGNPRSEIIKLLSRISSYRRRKTIRKEGSIEDRAE
jgi:hypothetical protein